MRNAVYHKVKWFHAEDANIRPIHELTSPEVIWRSQEDNGWGVMLKYEKEDALKRLVELLYIEQDDGSWILA